MAYSGCFSPHPGFCLRGDRSDGCGPFNEALPDWEHRDAHCHRKEERDRPGRSVRRRICLACCRRVGGTPTAAVETTVLPICNLHRSG
jgi:hypothetical protein